MGFFAVFCAESGLVLTGHTALLPIAETGSGGFEAIALPIVSTYDRLGKVDLPDPLDPWEVDPSEAPTTVPQTTRLSSGWAVSSPRSMIS